MTLDASGNTVAETRYYPFGETRVSTGAMPTDRLYTGQRLIDGLGGLYHYNARFYLPKLGRFISADTIVPEPSNPQSWNRYSYVMNNPVRYVDPSGHVCVDANGDAMPGNCQGRSPTRVVNASGSGINGIGSTAQEALASYCAKAVCSGPDIGNVTIDLGFTGNLVGSDPGVVTLPYHTSAGKLGSSDLFPWEGVANVAYNEHRQLHPYNNTRDRRAYNHFLNHWLGDATGIMQTMINRADSGDFKYETANEAALAEGQYASPIQRVGDKAYHEFYGLAFLVVEMNVRVDQPYSYFAHQDNLDIRGSSATGNLNDTCCTDTTAFGPTAGRKDFYITLPFPAIYDEP